MSLAKLGPTVLALSLLGCATEAKELPEPELRCSPPARAVASHGCVVGPLPSSSAAASSGIPASDAVRARALYRDGEKAYEAAEWAEALAKFAASEAIRPRPQTERYIGLCQDALGNAADAIAAYTLFLEHVPDNMGDEAEQARQRIQALSDGSNSP